MLDKGIVREHIGRGEGGLRYPIARWVNCNFSPTRHRRVKQPRLILGLRTVVIVHARIFLSQFETICC